MQWLAIWFSSAFEIFKSNKSEIYFGGTLKYSSVSWFMLMLASVYSKGTKSNLAFVTFGINPFSPSKNSSTKLIYFYVENDSSNPANLPISYLWFISADVSNTTKELIASCISSIFGYSSSRSRLQISYIVLLNLWRNSLAWYTVSLYFLSKSLN